MKFQIIKQNGGKCKNKLNLKLNAQLSKKCFLKNSIDVILAIHLVIILKKLIKLIQIFVNRQVL